MAPAKTARAASLICPFFYLRISKEGSSQARLAMNTLDCVRADSCQSQKGTSEFVPSQSRRARARGEVDQRSISIFNRLTAAFRSRPLRCLLLNLSTLSAHLLAPAASRHDNVSVGWESFLSGKALTLCAMNGCWPCLVYPELTYSKPLQRFHTRLVHAVQETKRPSRPCPFKYALRLFHL